MRVQPHFVRYLQPQPQPVPAKPTSNLEKFPVIRNTPQPGSGSYVTRRFPSDGDCMPARPHPRPGHPGPCKPPSNGWGWLFPVQPPRRRPLPPPGSGVLDPISWLKHFIDYLRSHGLPVGKGHRIYPVQLHSEAPPRPNDTLKG